MSYTLAYQHSGAMPGSGAGIGDLVLNYRYQLIGSGETRLAVSPRVSIIVSTGDPLFGRGFGGTGVQTNLPVSWVVKPKLVTHWNAGATWIPHALSTAGQRGYVNGYNLGQSFVWLAKPRFNALVETAYTLTNTAILHNSPTRDASVYVSPGIRWAHNLKSGLQIVPGVAFPIGVGPSGGEKGVFLYLSFEHPLSAVFK